MLRQLSKMSVVMSMLLISGGGMGQSQSPQSASKLAIRITSAEAKLAFDKPIRVIVSIANVGQQELLVGKNLPGTQSDSAYVFFLMSDWQGRSPEGSATVGDRFTMNPESFANAVLKNYVAIPPGFSYSFSVDVRRYAPEFFGRPGIYKLRAVYRCTGIRTLIENQRLRASDEDIKSLPFPVWEGSVESSELQVEIVRK